MSSFDGGAVHAVGKRGNDQYSRSDSSAAELLDDDRIVSLVRIFPDLREDEAVVSPGGARERGADPLVGRGDFGGPGPVLVEVQHEAAAAVAHWPATCRTLVRKVAGSAILRSMVLPRAPRGLDTSGGTSPPRGRRSRRAFFRRRRWRWRGQRRGCGWSCGVSVVGSCTRKDTPG